MSAAFPRDLTAAPRGGKVAWVFNAEGVRNVWVAAPARPGGSYTARRLTDYKADDGQDIGELAWLPNAQAIVYVRGGDFENGGPYPNPRSLPEGVEQDVWLARLGGGEPRLLGEGHSPAVSPQGTRVAFIDHGQVWLATIPPGSSAVQLIHARGKAESLRWSPDGKKLAFVSDRRDHRLIGVYDFAARAVRWMDPSVDLDGWPVWSPDGKQIAFIRVPASEHDRIFGPEPSGQPWSIRVASAATGVGRQIWKAQAGPGSVFHQVSARNQLFWAAGNRLVFPWERDGWTHLYSLSAEGGRARLLTPGGFIVQDVAIGPRRRELIFNSNENDIDRRHLWKEPVDGRAPTAVTTGSGIEWSPVIASNGRILFLHSGARRPARPAVLEHSGRMRDLVPGAIPPDFPARWMATPRPVMLTAADGLRIHGQLFLPRNDARGKRRPAIVFLHGGSQRQMLLGWHPMNYYSNAYALNQYLVSRGYIVLSINYRGGSGYGLDFREAPKIGAAGASELKDVEAAGLYLRRRPDVDPHRIGVWGGSWGGYLTALALARASDLFAAGVDLAGVHNWNLEIPAWVPADNPQRQPAAERLALESSPLDYMKTWKSPVLLVQGDDDRNVSFREMIQLVEALRRYQVPFRQIVFPDEVHIFLLHSNWLKAFHAASNFFDRYLGGKPGRNP